MKIRRNFLTAGHLVCLRPCRARSNCLNRQATQATALKKALPKYVQQKQCFSPTQSPSERKYASSWIFNLLTFVAQGRILCATRMWRHNCLPHSPKSLTHQIRKRSPSSNAIMLHLLSCHSLVYFNGLFLMISILVILSFITLLHWTVHVLL